ncbi:MAG: formylglycine-generating enzyme family protein [Prevotellaceae bacterium]|jgi:formylglycine-generating enzyme required for sulfatase activity|nr:formylglycine-generating enzyme family protein [Prevotellaceae bacterium]
MKQNYKISLCALLLVGATGMMTIGALGADKPKLAVLVVGMGSAAKSDDFAVRLGSDLNRDGKYELVTKDNSAVADKLTALRAQTTPVDTTGLAAWGKANGIDFVQLVVQTPDYGGMKTSRMAQLVDCNTGKLSERDTYSMFFTPKGIAANAVIELVPVAGGVFEMGCKEGRDDKDGNCSSDELLHMVRVNDFHIGKYVITQAQWRAMMGSLPSGFTSNPTYLGDNKPIIFVSYDSIVSKTGFLARLNKLTGKNYRLPTEAEWEYAARGCDSGKCENYQYSGSDDIEEVAHYSQYASIGPTTVGTKKPNRLGIYDMSGNAWEWCRDWYNISYYTTANNPLDNPEDTTPASHRVMRGGGWTSYATECRTASRRRDSPYIGSIGHSFRVVLPAQ